MPFQELIADSEYKEAAMLCPKALWQTGPPGPSQAPSGEASAAPVEPPLPPPPPPPGGQTTADSLDTYVDTAVLELESLPRGGLQARHSSQGLFE